MKRTGMLLLTVWLAVALVAPAAEEAEEKEQGRKQDEMVAQVRDQVLDQVNARLEKILDRRAAEQAEVEPLGKTLTLQFQLPLGDKAEKPMSVVAAARGYGIEVQMNNNGQSFHFEVHGRLALDPKATDAVLVTYQASLKFEGGETEGSLSAEGSVLAKYGKPVPLAQFGDKSLHLTVVPGE